MISVLLNLGTATMIGGTLPNDEGVAQIITQPKRSLIEKRDGIVAVTGAVVPDEALAVAEVISAIPVEPLVYSVTGHPIICAFDRPAIAQLKVLMKMNFIHID